MFGWEFPPHISGGLGIACHGLTEALAKDGVNVLFVVPTLKGDEQLTHGQLISANKIVVPFENEPGELPLPVSQTTTITSPVERISISKAEEIVTTLRVPSTISPYHPAAENMQTLKGMRWNYSFEEKYSISRIYPTEPDEIMPATRGITFDFSGSYGPALMEEVEKYAIVAQAISSQYAFDVIHAHDWMTFKAGIEAKRKTNKPLVVHIHATEFDRAGNKGQPDVYKLEREGMREADRVIAVSERTKAIAIREYEIPDEKIIVVHNGISPSGNTTDRFEAPLGPHVVTFLGRVTYQKGPLYFVEAARKVLEQFPTAHFLVAGAGDLLPAMIERVAQLRISSNFHFTGFAKKEDVEKIWSISGVYVMPSVSEPFGITPLEAIQAGVPVIISNQAGVGEVMPHAIKVEFWDTSALAEAICSVLKYKSLSKTLKKNSSAEIKNISWTKASQKIKTLYYELNT